MSCCNGINFSIGSSHNSHSYAARYTNTDKGWPKLQGLVTIIIIMHYYYY